MAVAGGKLLDSWITLSTPAADWAYPLKAKNFRKITKHKRDRLRGTLAIIPSQKKLKLAF